MSDESNTARRLRRHLDRRRLFVGAVVALGIVATVGTPLIANAGDVPARLRALQGADASVPASAVTESSSEGAATDDDAPAGTVEVHVAPVLGATLDPASPTVLQVEIRNGTAETVGAGVVHLSRSASPLLTSPAALESWLSPDRGGAQLAALGEASSPVLLAGTSATVSFPLPADFLGDAAGAPVAGIAAEVVSADDGTPIAEGQAAFALSTATGGGPRLSLIAAITVPSRPRGSSTGSRSRR
ncbi:hypothetical protein ET445_04005 [Agromyces protaetiae]|uniref:Uncharacterized protein n=1 Tax=Agromyces protaetiae TaxID=2509455 RepID=A0A4P6F9P3_9MICO|nr:DUF6049 family protein [Agromyces protaetiae]QAY72632.1 hypothetical protein ET445_04005 [Agromyces protaetiae]